MIYEHCLGVIRQLKTNVNQSSPTMVYVYSYFDGNFWKDIIFCSKCLIVRFCFFFQIYYFRFNQQEPDSSNAYYLQRMFI